MRILLRRVLKGDEGQDLTEYGLLLMFIALVAITVIHGFGSVVKNAFSNASSSLS
jgi:Flp pilus assembly pilin Flp